MPTYDYICDACAHRFEIYQGIKDDALKACPSCKAKKLRRLFGAGGGILFKGSGFYQTDYRSDSYKSGEKTDSGDGGAGCAKPDCGPTGCGT